MNARAMLASLLLLAACAHGAAGTATTTDALAPRFADASAQRAKQDAPDFYARAERAYQDARNASDADARGDHTTRARILLDAAIAEADRIALDRAATASDTRAEQAVLQRAELERQRLELEQAIKRELAAASAREEAARAFQQSALDEQARPGRAKEADANRDQASRFVRDRATLTLAAAIALGLDPVRGDALAGAIAAAEHAATPAARMYAAQRALTDAERALGEARKAHAASPEETAALIALAKERGLAPEPLPRGIAFDLDAAFAAGSAVPNAAGKHMLAGLATVASAHPHGPIQIEALAAPTAPAGVQRAATTRAEQIKAALAAATDATRLVLVPAADATTAPHARVVFAAYGIGAESTPAP
jgi:hypothetical protein